MKANQTPALAKLLFASLLTIAAPSYGQMQPLTPVSHSAWQPLPQFQPKNQTTHHWYALENEQNGTYWQNVNVSRLIICLKTGQHVPAIQDLVIKYNLHVTDSNDMSPEIINFFEFAVPQSSKQKVLQIIKDAKLNAAVEYVEPEAIIKSQTCVPSDPALYPKTGWTAWSTYSTQIDSAWCLLTKGTWGQWIGVIDNALDYTHPDLGPILENDFADGDPDVFPDLTGTQNHGTHVTGIVAARINNALGIAGVANDTVCFIKAMKNYDTSFSNAAIIKAIIEMAKYPKLRVINMSFGSYSSNASIEAACDNAWANNKLLIASAGNDATTALHYPSNYNSVISVGSVGINPTTGLMTFSSAFSNYGNDQELTAPGGNGDGGIYDIVSTMPGNNYAYMAGTSMAAPMVTGLAALMFDINPSLTNAQARKILQQSVFDPTPSTPWDIYYGYGIICGWCAVQAARDFIAPPPSSSSEVFISNKEGNTILIAPNPNNGKFDLWILDKNDDTQISIYNTVGKRVWAGTHDGENSISVDISEQPSGIYYAKIKTSGNEHTQRIAIVK